MMSTSAAGCSTSAAATVGLWVITVQTRPTVARARALVLLAPSPHQGQAARAG
jgi:hypothetical protein